MSCSKYGFTEVEDVCLDAVTCAEEANAVAIVLVTRGNETARWTSKYHGKSPIFVLTDNDLIMNQVEGYYRGCISIKIEKELSNEEVAAVMHSKVESGTVVVVNDWENKAVMSKISI